LGRDVTASMPSDNAQAHTFRYGTSSWSEKSWVGPFYPKGTKPGDMLTYYSTQFTTVEADNTYYRIPTASMVRGWRTKTPEGFLLAAKVPRDIVHAGEGATPDGSKVLVLDHVRGKLDAFLDVMRLLGDRAGPMVVQLPYFNKSAFSSVNEFLDRLGPFLEALPPDFRYGVEVRNKAWVGTPLLDMLRARNVAFVLVDLVYMPHPADLAREHDLITADFTYARLIGDRKAVEAKTETFDRIVIDNGASLDRWADLLAQLGSRVRMTMAFANNHYAGYGVQTIRDLVQRLEERKA